MTEQQEKIVSWLNRAFYAEHKARALEAALDRNREIAERCTASYESVGSSGTHVNSQELNIHRLCDDNARIRDQLRELVVLRKEIETAIFSVENDEYESILSMRYLSYMTMQQIADELHYDKRTVQRKHMRAIDVLIQKSCHCLSPLDCDIIMIEKADRK